MWLVLEEHWLNLSASTCYCQRNSLIVLSPDRGHCAHLTYTIIAAILKRAFLIVIRCMTDEMLLYLLSSSSLSCQSSLQENQCRGFFFLTYICSHLCESVYYICVFRHPLYVCLKCPSVSLSSSCPVVGCGNTDVKEADLIPDQMLRRKIQSQKRQGNRT